MHSSELRGFLTGLILGDGSIDKGVSKRAFEIKSINRDYIDNIAAEIKSCSGFKSKITHCPEHYSGGCNHKESWSFRIMAHPYFAKIYHDFYDDYRRRIITGRALEWLTPYGLANWYMSDGYVCLVGKTKGVIRSRRVDLCTDRYSIDNIHKIQECLLNKFCINTSMIHRDNHCRIRIAYTSYNDFFEMVYPYLVPSMRYKAYLGYSSRPIWMSDYLWSIQEDLESANPLLLVA